LKRPDLHLAIALNARVRAWDEWFDEPDELDRVEKALKSIDDVDDPLKASALLAYRVTRAQGFTEANKRTALLLARWVLDSNGIDGRRILDPDDRELADLLIQAASGNDVEADVVRFFVDKADALDYPK
jgi:prophage maintenance system killer protein